MRNRKLFIRIVCILLAVLFVLSLVMMVVPSRAEAASSDEIRDEINGLNGQQSAIQERMDQIQSEIDSLAYQQSNTLEKKLILDQKNVLAQQELDVIQEQIDIIDGQLTAIQEDLSGARSEEEYQRQRWLTRVRAMEETSQVDYLQVLFSASSFSDLLTRMDLVGEVMDYDEKLEAQYAAAREKVEALEAQAEQMFAENESHRQELQAKKSQLETDIAAACGLIAQMEQNADEYEQVLAQEQETQAQIQALIVQKEEEFRVARQAEEAERQRQLAAQLAAQQQAAQQAAPPAESEEESSGGGQEQEQSGGEQQQAPSANGTWMMWPSYTRTITSVYGMRLDPVSKKITRLHAGVDIGASYGSQIYAAAAGTVIQAGENGGYGNCVMVNHGNGYTTLYAHMSSIAAYSGQSVSQGQVLGYVGTTGNVTGPHLHFEVRSSASGDPMDPMAFSYY